MYNGPDAPFDLRLDLDSTALLTATEDLRAHVNGSSFMSEADISAAREIIVENGPLLPTELTIMDSALDLIEEFDTNLALGPLFINSRSLPGLPRFSSTDGKEIERAIIQLRQTALDEIYSGTKKNYETSERIYPSIIEECSSYLDKRRWESATYFPGDIQGLASDPNTVHSLSINTTHGSCWGRPAIFCDEPGIRPTGLWLIAGKVAVVTVPPEIVSFGGFKIQVGANVIDNSNKNTHLRNDRITSTYDIKNETIYVANPNGGGVYLRVPYTNDLGVVAISITGSVVKAPYFRHTDMHITKDLEWMGVGGVGGNREAPGPWLDLETENFLLTVPRRWVYGYDYEHVLALAMNYTSGMNGVLDFLGFQDGETKREVLYESVDRHIRAGAYGIGSPQVNGVVNVDASGPTIAGGGVDGQANHWLVARPHSDDTSFHELGHARLFTKYPGEEEAAVNLLITYVQNVKDGVDFDDAFIASFPRTGQYTVDRAAIHWMIKDNFMKGNPMDQTNSEYNEMRYQHRGYAKYADLARLHAKGWGVWTDFWRQEHLDYNVGINQ